jgi:hypothetical protein
VWRSGAHFLISPNDWPDLLPEAVLGAVRRAPLVNNDPLMRDLRGPAATTRAEHFPRVRAWDRGRG